MCRGLAQPYLASYQQQHNKHCLRSHKACNRQTSWVCADKWNTVQGVNEQAGGESGGVAGAWGEPQVAAVGSAVWERPVHAVCSMHGGRTSITIVCLA